MLTPEELAALRALHEAHERNKSVSGAEILSQNAHSAIGKLLKQAKEPWLVDARVPIARDGHEDRTSKFALGEINRREDFEKLLGFCVCVHCAKLPDWAPDPQPRVPGVHEQHCAKAHDHTKACNCRLAGNYRAAPDFAGWTDAEIAKEAAPWPTALPHETTLVRDVLSKVSEHLPTMRLKGRYVEHERKPHDMTVTEAVHATLAALGYTISLDGSVRKP